MSTRATAHRKTAGIACGRFLNLARCIALKHHIDAAQGYFELGMADEALAELDRVAADDRCRAEVGQLRVLILMRVSRWSEALAVCEALRADHPGLGAGYIQGAFCLHELARTEEAMRLLLEGPASLLRDPVYFYNLGCYHAVLGRPEEARNYLQMSFNIDEKLREIARLDPDLASLAARI